MGFVSNSFLFLLLNDNEDSIVRLILSSIVGNNEEQYYTKNRWENARCELFPGSANGRLIIEARRVRNRIEKSKRNRICFFSGRKI